MVYLTESQYKYFYGDKKSTCIEVQRPGSLSDGVVDKFGFYSVDTGVDGAGTEERRRIDICVAG